LVLRAALLEFSWVGEFGVLVWVLLWVLLWEVEEVFSEFVLGCVVAVPFGVVEETGVRFCACTEARSRRAKVASAANLVSFFIRPLLTV
jgi:hypothetical protein